MQMTGTGSSGTETEGTETEGSLGLAQAMQRRWKRNGSCLFAYWPWMLTNTTEVCRWYGGLIITGIH